MKKLLFALPLVIFTIAHGAEEPLKVTEGRRSLQVLATAPIPDNETNEVQAKALSREAAIVRGQTALLEYVLQKKTHSNKTLAEAEKPSVPLQQNIRGYIKGAQAMKTVWKNNVCTVTLVLDKSHLNEILRRN